MWASEMPPPSRPRREIQPEDQRRPGLDQTKPDPERSFYKARRTVFLERLTQLTAFADVRRGTVAFEISVQVSASPAVQAGLVLALVHI